MIQIKIQSLYQSYYYYLQIKLNKERSLPMNSQYFFTKFIKTDLLMVLFENTHIVFTVKQYDVVIRDQPAKNNYHHEEKVLQIRHIHDSDVRENKVCIELKNVSTLTLKYEDMKNIAHRSVFVNIQELFQMMRDDQYPQIEKFYDFVRVIFQYKCKHSQMPTYFQVELKYIPKDEKNQNQEPQILEGQTEMKNEEPMQDIKKKKKKQSMIDEREEDPGRINDIKTEIKGIKNKINSLANNMKESKINFQNRLNQVVYKTQQKFNVLDKRLANHLNICHMNRQIYYSPIITVEKTIKLIKNNYIFSQFFMNPNIKLKSQKLIMCNSKDNSLKIAMIQPPLFIDPNYKQPYYYKISLKVVKIGAYVGVGIRDNQFAKNISFKQYRQNSQTDQSLYILDYHGDIWSHYQVDEGQENPKNKAFQFQANDVIEIKFIPDISKVTFKLRSDQSRFSLKVNPKLNFNFSFCVYLQGQGDEVQIIENIERNLHAARKHSYPVQIKNK